MNTDHVILYVHLLSLFAMVGGITIFGVCYSRLRSARSGEAAAPWIRLAEQSGWLFPLSILGLLASGAYLTFHAWTWGTAWIDASIAGLIVVALQGPLVGGPRTQALKDTIEANGPGSLGEPARRLTRDRALWIVLLANPGVVLGIVWNMTAKPDALGAIAAIIVGYAVGAVAALAYSRAAPG